MVNDERAVLEIFDILIRRWFADATVLMFGNGADALRELSRTDPDLLITDDRMAGMSGMELCLRLLDKKVTYPIIVDSPWEPTEQWVQAFATRGLNVSFLSLPCDVAGLRSRVEASLKIKIQTEQAQEPVEAGRPVRFFTAAQEPPHR